MDTKEKQLLELHSYVEGVDKEVTMLLQSLQWDRKHLLEGGPLVSCQYDENHRVPPDKQDTHEKECFLRFHGYSEDDKMLPDPVDSNAPTIVKLSSKDIKQIIDKAAYTDPIFRRGRGCEGCEPLTAERLQATYTTDERRAIHDAVVSTAPDYEHDDNLVLMGTGTESEKRAKSKLEVLAELRNMRRRRTKYRVATGASKNYSNVLRELIKTQMEMYSGCQAEMETPNTSSTQQWEHKSLTKDSNTRRYNDDEIRVKDEYDGNDRHEVRSNSRDRKSYEHKRLTKDSNTRRYNDDEIRVKDEYDGNDRHEVRSNSRDRKSYEHKRLTKDFNTRKYNDNEIREKDGYNENDGYKARSNSRDRKSYEHKRLTRNSNTRKYNDDEIREKDDYDTKDRHKARSNSRDTTIYRDRKKAHYQDDKDKHRYTKPQDRYSDKNDRRSEKYSTRDRKHFRDYEDNSSNLKDMRTVEKDGRRDESSSGSNKNDYANRNERSYKSKKYGDSSSYGSTERHREKDRDREENADSSQEGRKYKTYYDVKRKNNLSHEDVKRKRHS